MATKKKAPVKTKKPVTRGTTVAKSVKAVAKKLLDKRINGPNRNTKVFALQSGFELIGTIVHSDAESVYLHRPGAILRMNQSLEGGGIQQIYFLIPSYAFAVNDMIQVIKSSIAIVCIPDEYMMKTYDAFIAGEYDAMIEKPAKEKKATKKVVDGQKLSDL